MSNVEYPSLKTVPDKRFVRRMCGSGTVFPDGGDSILHGADVFIVETGSKGGKDVLSDTDLYAAAMRGTGGLLRIMG